MGIWSALLNFLFSGVVCYTWLHYFLICVATKARTRLAKPGFAADRTSVARSWSSSLSKRVASSKAALAPSSRLPASTGQPLDMASPIFSRLDLGQKSRF